MISIFSTAGMLLYISCLTGGWYCQFILSLYSLFNYLTLLWLRRKNCLTLRHFIILQNESYITLHDLKGSKLSGSVFNILFNLNKFMAFETRDPFLIRQVHALFSFWIVQFFIPVYSLHCILQWTFAGLLSFLVNVITCYDFGEKTGAWKSHLDWVGSFCT